MFQRLGGRFGSLIQGDTPPPPAQVAANAGQGSASASVGMGERSNPQPAEGLMSMLPSPAVYEGVPVAQRPPHQQIRCMTCNQGLEDEQRRVMCHVCSSWMHDTCVETVKIGSSWKADMCLNCQQAMTKQLRVISAQELKKGREWNQDVWFQDLKVLVDAGTGWGVTRNRDLNELWK